MKKIAFWLSTCALLQSHSLAAPADTDSVDMPTMVVIASKIARPISHVAGSVAVIDATDIQQNIVQNMDELLRFQPGINVARAGTRFASEGINIRGIGGNRVAMEIDGVPIQSQFSISNFSNTGRDTLEVESVKRIEILNGPASTLYGSRAIGGVMVVTTWDPQDLVQGASTGFRGKAGYNSVDDSRMVSAGAAWQDQNTGLMAFYTHRDGHQADNQANPQFQDDSQDWDTDSLLVKYVWESSAGNHLTLKYNGFRQEALTDLRSVLGLGRFSNTTKLSGDDNSHSNALSADFSFSTNWLDSGVARLFYQDASVQQDTFETRIGRRPVEIGRQFSFDESVAGFELLGFRQFQTDNTAQYLGFGLEYQQNELSEQRDATSTDLGSGTQTNILLGEVFPTRDFPQTKTREFGLFINNEIQLGNSGWSLIPGLRYDNYRLTPHRDSIFDTNNADVLLSNISEQGISPKLGLVYHFNSHWNLFGQYAHGFRAPPSQDVNRALFLPFFKFRVLPNPDLNSETSDGLELGIRKNSPTSEFSFSVFHTQYDDFIESAALVGFDPTSGELQFQSRNITNARIYGAEIHWKHSLENYVQGLRFEGGVYWSRGKNLDTEQPLNTVSPAQLVAGLNWHSPKQRFRTALMATFSDSQDHIDQTEAEHFATPSYGLLDLTAGWRISDSMQLEVGVFNLLDKKYWRWSDVSRFTPDDPIIEVLSRPGRNISLNFKVSL